MKTQKFELRVSGRKSVALADLRAVCVFVCVCVCVCVLGVGCWYIWLQLARLGVAGKRENSDAAAGHCGTWKPWAPDCGWGVRQLGCVGCPAAAAHLPAIFFLSAQQC